MKIVDVAEFYAEQGGGVRTYINQKLRAARERGHEMVIVAPGPEDGEEERHGGRVIWIGGPPMPLDPRYYVLWRERRVHAILDRERPAVVEGSSPWTGGWFAARWRGQAVKVLVFHSDPVAIYPHLLLDRWLRPDRVDRLFGWFWAYLRALSRHFEVTVVAGRWLAERLARFGIQRPTCVTFGVDHQEFSDAKADPGLRRDLLAACGLPPDATLLLGAGRHHPEKRWTTVMRGVARARGERAIGLVLFGDGPSRPRLERVARAVGHIHLAGAVDRERLATAFASADALVHGSVCETYGLAVAEALCAGLPLIVPEAGGAGDFADPSCAETYRGGDAEDCAAAIARLLDRDRRALHAAAARVAAARIRSPEEHFDELFALYEELAHVRG